MTPRLYKIELIGVVVCALAFWWLGWWAIAAGFAAMVATSAQWRRP